MKSQWYELKEEAIRLRKKGYSIGSVEQKLGIRRSTLSGWFRTVELNADQKAKLKKAWLEGLIKARQKAALWHNSQKANRLAEAKKEAISTFKRINTNDKCILDLALAMLYFGEGFKKTDETAMGNSDPIILKFFISVLRKNYKLDAGKIKCELHLRADQDPKKVKLFWAKELNLSLENFTSISIDYRTTGSVTYPNYHGVCVLRCGTVAIQRKLINLYNLFCEKVIQDSERG